jgi:hypothetical protein
MRYLKLAVVASFVAYAYVAITSLGSAISISKLFAFLAAGLFVLYLVLKFGFKFHENMNAFDTALDGVTLILGAFAILAVIFAIV